LYPQEGLMYGSMEQGKTGSVWIELLTDLALWKGEEKKANAVCRSWEYVQIFFFLRSRGSGAPKKGGHRGGGEK